MEIKNGIGIFRISGASKQITHGDSPEDQKEQIKQFAKRTNIRIKKFFKFIESAREGKSPLQPVLEYCKENQGKIDVAIIKSIDRGTRGGAYIYEDLKRKFARYGVSLVDIYGIIGNQKINTLEHLGIKYDWSVYSPTHITELLEAERAKTEIRDILSRMIGAQIRFERMGYWTKPAPPGFINKKRHTEHGKRTFLKPHPKEEKWFIRMFELRAQGNLTDEEIVVQINSMGYKSRRKRRLDPNDKTKVIGYFGEKPLTVKQLRRYIRNPLYAGILQTEWTEGKPIKARFDGLVQPELFNKANRGKVVIVENKDGSVQIFRGKPPAWQMRKNKDNPLYPYKQYILCPICDKPLLGSASRGKAGKRYPAYHCNRSHYFRMPLKEFNQTVESFVKQIKFNEGFGKRFREIVLEEWEKREQQLADDQIDYGKRIIEIEGELKMLMLTIVLKCAQLENNFVQK